MKFDVVVVGSGIAGLSFALKTAKLGHKVAIVTKKERSDTNTNHAQGGIASVTSGTDNFDSHVKDTLIAGDGLCHEDVVREIVSSGPEQIKDLIADKETVGTAMMQEVDRCQQAIDLALEGYKVVVVSSGDPGIYGMAGLVMELANKVDADRRPEVEIIPGLSAVNVAASVLGAPLMHDFAVISLSDLMTPWELIKKRADLCAEGDMVIALYNPRSKKRVTHLDEVRELVLKHRDPKTPVGIVQKAGRKGQHIVISDLEHFTKEEVDMQTLVIIGNSQTYVENGRMITPRGYKL